MSRSVLTCSHPRPHRTTGTSLASPLLPPFSPEVGIAMATAVGCQAGTCAGVGIKPRVKLATAKAGSQQLPPGTRTPPGEIKD